MTLDLVVSIKKESREIIKEVNEKRGQVEEVPVLRKGVRKALKMRRWREKDKFKYLKKNKSGKEREREKSKQKRKRERGVEKKGESFAESVDGTSGNGM